MSPAMRTLGRGPLLVLLAAACVVAWRARSLALALVGLAWFVQRLFFV